ASNSLLEALVYAYRSFEYLKRFLKEKQSDIPEIPEWDDSGTLSADEHVLITHSLKEVKQTMGDYVGIVRSNQRLERASKRIHTIFIEIEEFYKKTKVFNKLLELRNLITCSHIIIKSAKLREESRGLHFTIDYPGKLPDLEVKDTIIENVHS
ncbi:MAG: L-aspartate oxidase, partial [Ignavibacteriaceae bacterium]|nr:L-aspartate oxidase [Ignavibacteriaceae bacterium]